MFFVSLKDYAEGILGNSMHSLTLGEVLHRQPLWSKHPAKLLHTHTHTVSYLTQTAHCLELGTTFIVKNINQTYSSAKKYWDIKNVWMSMHSIQNIKISDEIWSKWWQNKFTFHFWNQKVNIQFYLQTNETTA